MNYEINLSNLCALVVMLDVVAVVDDFSLRYVERFAIYEKKVHPCGFVLWSDIGTYECEKCNPYSHNKKDRRFLIYFFHFFGCVCLLVVAGTQNTQILNGGYVH